MKSYKAGDRVSKWEMSTLDYCDAGLELVQRVDTQGRRGGMCSKEGTKSSGK